MTYLYVFVWWFIGFLGMCALYLSRRPTWGELALMVVTGIMGPGAVLVGLIVVLVEADFWNKPVFPRRRK